MQPKPEDYDYELDQALTAVVGIRALVPPDAFTADILGTERGGHGVLIRKDGIVLTIGYLVTEAETVWITLSGGSTVPGHVLGYDQESGFGLVQALARIDVPVLPLGRSSSAEVGMRVVVGGGGGRKRSVAARIIAKQEFSGYWEYVLDEAILHRAGASILGRDGNDRPRGRPSRHRFPANPAGQLQPVAKAARQGDDANMIVPIDLLKPILDDLITIGRPNRPARPWLGLYATEIGNSVAVIGLASARAGAEGGPARGRHRAGGRRGQRDRSGGPLPERLGAGRSWRHVPLTVNREGRTFEASVRSVDRRRLLKGPVLH